MSQFNYPVYPTFKPVEIQDANFLQKWFKKYPLLLNEYTFSTLYCWRAYGCYEWSIWNNFLFVLFTNPNNSKESAFWAPCGEGDRLSALKLQIQYLQEYKSVHVPVVRLVTEPYISYFDFADCPYKVELDDANSDYIYRTADLMYLKGRKYSKKRNLIKQFLNAYNPEFKLLTPDLLKECLELQKKWCLKKECSDNEVLYYENIAVTEALENFVILNLKGGVVIVDKKIVGFALGEELIPDMGVVHFEKADTNYKGVYQYLTQQFATYFDNYPYIDREQDMGDDNLRQAKQSYFPSHKEKSYAVFLKRCDNNINDISARI